MALCRDKTLLWNFFFKFLDKLRMRQREPDNIQTNKKKSPIFNQVPMGFLKTLGHGSHLRR
jgi:hypothetical protein